MSRKDRRKQRAALGFLVDENVPAQVSDFIAARGYKVAHIGRSQIYLLPAPAKGTPDSLLKNEIKKLVFITQDQSLLRAGALPSRHRGVFVVDPANSSAAHVVRDLFDRIRWADDPILANRRFKVGLEYFVEIGSDGALIRRIW